MEIRQELSFFIFGASIDNISHILRTNLHKIDHANNKYICYSIMNRHGTVIDIQSAEQIESRQIVPTRSEFLNGDTVQKSQGLLKSNQPILFLSNDVAQSIAKDQYELILHGIMPCGTKTTVMIKGIYPYVDVETNISTPVADQVVQLKTKLNNQDIEFKHIEVVKGKNFMKFHAEQRQYMRVQFNTLKSRLEFIKMCADAKVNTFSNDRSTYYRVVSRNYEFNLSGWNYIQSYRQVYDGKYKSAISVVCDVKHIAPFDTDSPENINTITHMGFAPNLLKYEQMIVAGFDIEMIPYHPNAFPDADKCLKDSIFMICVTFHFAKKPESILSVILTLKKNEPLDDVLTIVCSDEACLLLTFSHLMHMMQPDFITEFNGGGFDWRNIIIKTRSFGIMPDFLRNMSIARMMSWELKDTMLSRYFQEKVIKIDGATAPCICKTLKMQGYVNFDTLVLFKQIEPKADSHRLDECLKRCNLGGKDSLPIAEMFRIYRQGTAAEMRLVAHYCFIDTCKLQALILKKNVIQDRREIATMSFTSIYDAFYYANGSKVRNLMMNVGEKKGYKFDTTYKPDIKDPDAKFQGAYVVPPIKGVVRPMLSYEEFACENNMPTNVDTLSSGYAYIAEHYDAIVNRSLDKTTIPESLVPYIDYLLTNENHYPVSGLDFSSLYPSIMMTYNITPEKLITDKEYADRMVEMGYRLHEVVFPFLNETVHAWFVQHENVKEKYGLCPSILIDLFAKRANMKKLMKPFAHRKLQLEEEMAVYEGNESFPHMQEYDEVCFEYNYLNSKQGAAKIFMNTFYGEIGNFLSFVCAIETAASVTAMGRYNLELAKKYVETQLKMKVYYGDTDSLYVACNKDHFYEYDRAYYSGKVPKLQYCTNLVTKTFELIEEAKQGVNAHLKANNNTDHLRMAYEEVLYPMVLVSKKKYFGIAHEESVNFYPKKPFLRGLEIVKRGVSEVLKDVCIQIVNQILDIKTTTDMMTLVRNAIDRFFNTKWDVSHFIKTAVYRLDKANPCVKKFIDRYKEMEYPSIPEPNVRFKYIMCKRYRTYDTCGLQIVPSVGDCMELVDRVIAKNIPIDLEYYFNREITGQLGRLIAFYEQFDTVDQNALSDILSEKERYTKIEETIFKNAKKYIAKLASQYSNPFPNKGRLFKNTYQLIAKTIKVKNMKTKNIELMGAPGVQKVIDILDGCHKNRDLGFMRRCIEQKIVNTHGVSIEDSLIEPLFAYVSEHQLFDYLQTRPKEWIANIVHHVRDKYKYDELCLQRESTNDPLDLFSKEELIQCIHEVPYVGLSVDHAKAIQQMIDTINAQFA